MHYIFHFHKTCCKIIKTLKVSRPFSFWVVFQETLYSLLLPILLVVLNKLVKLWHGQAREEKKVFWSFFKLYYIQFASAT
ncbi:hypothetical protein COT20_02325 [bacterium (Candidatus Gribaldobacteria) CG08_land_8_20_14_0_20_39_15]|uniref:Uncharacterized protein n=1 Tax=bacterium (Candidatus Gribaldobacteria) CG08_land_8_20_14_0_20_39_15 TaxID=2014273 RepID=A0A2M6XU30_9BACT|nr:MAG: hypothetical protein COT20_02325 [bacterium (Candidatus Gribaldobacteria) CG08_land_8_20_14_0_20_39_15]